MKDYKDYKIQISVKVPTRILAQFDKTVDEVNESRVKFYRYRNDAIEEAMKDFIAKHRGIKDDIVLMK